MMMTSSNYSDPFPRTTTTHHLEYLLWPTSPSRQESSSSSTTNIRAAFSDEEVTTTGLKLASNNPKKRAGRKKFRETRHPVYRGVRRRNSGKWVCEVREPNKKTRIWLGTFPTVEMAARAHDVAVLALRGRNACLNFADSAWRLPVPASGDVKDIQRAAAEAAEAFREEEVADSATAAADTKEVADQENCGCFYMDEEMVFGMHGLLDNMAEGLMMPPPRFTEDAEVEYVDADMSLWSFSI